MKNRILIETLQYLINQSSKKDLVELHLTRYFTTSELSDGSVGACMSYYDLPDEVLDVAEERLQRYCRQDIFNIREYSALAKIISESVKDKMQTYYILTSLLASIVSALSAQSIRRGDDHDFETSREEPRAWTQGAESALVVGFGGFLGRLVANPGIRNVHTVDLLYCRGRDHFESQLASFRAQFPAKSISASIRLSNRNEFKQFDLICITGSTLCNGTLEGLLASARKDAVVILQGQSASVHPRILFKAGVKWIATTLKPKALSAIAHEDHSGKMMRPFLEGGLQPVYLFPRVSRVGE
jgi:hypothetical protein